MQVEPGRRQRSTAGHSTGAPPDSGTGSAIGQLAPIVLAVGLGLVLCSLANAMARATLSPSQLIYWAGVLLIALPIFYRLTSREASPGERLALVCLLGLSLYSVKVIRDAPLFTFSDELIHAFNAEQVVDRQRLFGSNPILRATPSFPGLEGATSALMTLTGMTSFGAGIIVVGAARLSLVAAMFLLFSRVSGSTRTAGLGVAIYAGNFNFMYWGAQFSYASLSLPLLAIVMMALSEREADAPRWAREWAVPILLGIAAIVVTHHLTSYALVAFLVALAISYRLVKGTWGWANPWHFAAVAAALALAWLLLVANSTFGYIAPVLREAFDAIFSTAAGEAPARNLFESRDATAVETPTVARLIALLAVALLAAALPVGLARLWQRHSGSPMAIVFALAAMGFFGTLALRLAPEAWETGNRASEFLFIGLAFTAACAALETWRPRLVPGLGRVLLTAALCVVLVGGAISGWPWGQQLASTLRADAEGRTIVSPPLSLAEWAESNIPKDRRFAASPANARLLMTPAERTSLTGKTPDIEDILIEPAFAGWELPLLDRWNVRYVVADRREIASDALQGYFFTTTNRPHLNRLRPPEVISKFGEVPGAARVYASGDIAVYDLRALR